MNGAATARTRWWGEFALTETQRGFWRVGPLTLGIVRDRGEWRIERSSSSDPAKNELRLAVPSDESVTGDNATVSRFAFARTSEALWLTPRLADRAVIVSPGGPLFVPGGQETVLYCSTPLWIRVEVGDAKTLLEEFPTLRPPDTWFGPSTLEGELCYATTTAARLHREDIVHHPHRAVTELRIQNEARNTLQLERVKLSVPYLALYATDDGELWSDGMTMHRTADDAGGKLEVVKGTPRGLNAARIAPERMDDKQNVMFRAFEVLFA